MTSYPMRPLGDGLELDLDEIHVDPDANYRVAGIYSFGRGVFERKTISGAETSYKTLFRLHADRLVVSRLNGWEGALDVVQPAADGCVVSGEYPTFRLDASLLEVRYMYWLCRWPALWDRLVPRGSMVRRKRVNPKSVLDVVVPMPPTEEQGRIAARLDRLQRMLAGLFARVEETSPQSTLAMLPALIDGLLRSRSRATARVGDLADFISDPVARGQDPGSALVFVGPNHIESHTGRRLGSDQVGEDTGPKLRFRQGDVVYQRLRPYLNKAWVADRDGLCSIHQAVLRPKPQVKAELLGHALRCITALTAVIAQTPAQHLPEIRAAALAEIELPTDGVHDRDLVSRLDRVRDVTVDLADRRRRQVSAARAVMPSFLNEAFGGSG